MPTGENIIRMSLPLNVLKQKAASGKITTDMWMTSLLDRYKNRPDDEVFNDMCIATFASQYRVLSKNQSSRTKIKLKNECGYVTKRQRTEPAVLRYAHFSETKNPELLYQSLLQLFLPYCHDSQLKPLQFETFAQFYKHGSVKCGDGSIHSVLSIVHHNQCLFEKGAEDLDKIQNVLDNNVGGVLEDAWCDLCPEQELERLECIQEKDNTEPIVEEESQVIPDLATDSQHVSNLDKRK